MARGEDRFVWAISFLDLFTCALGGVFVLTLMAAREQQAHEVRDPAAYVFLSARFDSSVAGEVEAVLPNGFERVPVTEGVTWSADRKLVVVSARVPFDGVADGEGTIRLPARPKPDGLHGGTEAGPKGWDGSGEEFVLPGRGYTVKITWKK